MCVLAHLAQVGVRAHAVELKCVTGPCCTLPLLLSLKKKKSSGALFRQKKKSSRVRTGLAMRSE
jgi:hypothetical protein